MIKIRFEFTRFLFKLQNVVKIEFISIKGACIWGYYSRMYSYR